MQIPGASSGGIARRARIPKQISRALSGGGYEYIHKDIETTDSGCHMHKLTFATYVVWRRRVKTGRAPYRPGGERGFVENLKGPKPGRANREGPNRGDEEVDSKSGQAQIGGSQKKGRSKSWGPNAGLLLSQTTAN